MVVTLLFCPQTAGGDGHAVRDRLAGALDAGHSSRGPDKRLPPSGAAGRPGTLLRKTDDVTSKRNLSTQARADGATLIAVC